MAHAQKPDFVFRRNGRVHLNRQGRQFSRLLAAQVCASAVVMLDTPCSEVVWRVLATQSIRLHFPSRASPSAITFQLDSTTPDRLSNFMSVRLSALERFTRNLIFRTILRKLVDEFKIWLKSGKGKGKGRFMGLFQHCGRSAYCIPAFISRGATHHTDARDLLPPKAEIITKEFC